MTFQGQGHMISRSLLLNPVAYVRMHLCAKFNANRTIRLRVIQMAPDVTDRQSNRYTQVITIPTKRLLQRRFAVKMRENRRFKNKPIFRK